jgi:lysophospholipase L1-like esterase
MIRILFQGDSITDGNRYKDISKRWDLNHQIGHSYVFTVAGELGRKFPGKYHFINRGVSGDCVDKLTARWEEDTLAEHPDVLSLLVGINGNGALDGVYPEGAEAHLAHFDAAYRALLDAALAQNENLKLVIIEPFFLPVGKFKPTYARFMEVFSCKQAMIKRIAEDYGAVFIPVQKRLEKLVEQSAEALSAGGWEKDPCEYWLWDGVHPTEAMHAYLAELWLDAARDII